MKETQNKKLEVKVTVDENGVEHAEFVEVGATKSSEVKTQK